MKKTDVPSWTRVPAEAPLTFDVLPGVVPVPVPVDVVVVPFSMTMAVMSADPFTGSMFVCGMRLMMLPDGAVNGTREQAAAASTQPVTALTNRAIATLEKRGDTRRGIRANNDIRFMDSTPAAAIGPPTSDARGFILVAL